MTDTELAYAAGIMDGEGAIVISRSKQKNGERRYFLRVEVAQTNEWYPSGLGIVGAG